MESLNNIRNNLAKASVEKRDTLVMCMAVKYCMDNNLPTSSLLKNLIINVHLNHTIQVKYEDETIGTVFPPEIEEGADGPQKFMRMEIKYEPNYPYFRDEELMRQVDIFKKVHLEDLLERSNL